jgi:hypothetical protein
VGKASEQDSVVAALYLTMTDERPLVVMGRVGREMDGVSSGVDLASGGPGGMPAGETAFVVWQWVIGSPTTVPVNVEADAAYNHTLTCSWQPQ